MNGDYVGVAANVSEFIVVGPDADLASKVAHESYTFKVETMLRRGGHRITAARFLRRWIDCYHFLLWLMILLMFKRTDHWSESLTEDKRDRQTNSCPPASCLYMHVYIMARDELVCVIEPFTSLSIRTECDQQLAFPSTTYNSICEAPQCFFFFKLIRVDFFRIPDMRFTVFSLLSNVCPYYRRPPPLFSFDEHEYSTLNPRQ